MKNKILYFSLLSVIIFSYPPVIYTQEKKVITKIKISFDSNEIIADIYDTALANEFLKTLPISLSFDDYNNIEKVASLQKKLSTARETYSHNLLAGDIAYYVPWNNLVFYYKDFNYTGSGIVKIGKMNGGVEKINAMKNGTSVKIEIVK